MFGSATAKSQVLNKKLHLKDNSFRKWYSSSPNFRAKVRHLLISSYGSVLMREQHERMYGPFATQRLDRKYECGEWLAQPQKFRRHTRDWTWFPIRKAMAHLLI